MCENGSVRKDAVAILGRRLALTLQRNEQRTTASEPQSVRSCSTSNMTGTFARILITHKFTEIRHQFSKADVLEETALT